MKIFQILDGQKTKQIKIVLQLKYVLNKTTKYINTEGEVEESKIVKFLGLKRKKDIFKFYI